MANAESAKDILAEYISQADHDDKYVDCVRVDDLRFIMAAIKSQQAEIEQLNRFVNGFSRDAMPVVRCKDCKHGYKCEFNVKCENIGEPGMYGTRHGFNWFCADGELC